jgi:hypothetical protein
VKRVEGEVEGSAVSTLCTTTQSQNIYARPESKSQSHLMCHPDRSEAEWRDLLVQLFAPELNLKILMPGT